MNLDSKIYVAGINGMAGSAIARALYERGYRRFRGHSRQNLDLMDFEAVCEEFTDNLPEYVFLAAAKVGGIKANMDQPVAFLEENLVIQRNVIHAAWKTGVKKLLFLGSSCIYPKHAPQPIREESLLSSPLEPTNEWYAIAKIAGVKLCQAYRRQHGADFISAMPTNLYGPNDNFDPETSHVIPGMLRRFHEAKMRGDGFVTCWGSGWPRREFLHVDDLAAACVHLMACYSGEMPVNVGVGEDIALWELAVLIREVVGYGGEIRWDPGYPDGTPRKLLDVSRIKELGWKPKVSLRDGLRAVYEVMPK